MTDDTDRQLIRDALNYRSGPDSLNSLYMGGMATADLYRKLGAKYGKPETFEPALQAASRYTLDAALASCKNIIDHMEKHPMKLCPCCGSVLATG